MADDARSREEGSTSESDYEDVKEEEEEEQVLEEREATVDHGEASVASRDDSSSTITKADNAKSDDTTIGRNASMTSRDESFTMRNTNNAKFDDTTIGQEASITSRDDSFTVKDTNDAKSVNTAKSWKASLPSRDDSSIMTDVDNSKSDDTAIGRGVDGESRNSEDNKSFHDFERERFELAEEEHFEQVPLKDGEEGTFEQIIGLDKVSLEEDSRMSTAAEKPELDGGGEFITRTDEARSVDDRYKSQSPQHSSRPVLNSFETGNGLSLPSTRPPHVLPDASPELMHLIDSAIQESDSSSLGRLRAVLVGKERLRNDREEDAPEALVDVLLAKMRGLEGLEDSTYGSAPIVMLSARAATVAGKLIPWLPYGHDSESYTSPRTRLVNGLLMILKSCTRNRSMCAAAGLLQVLLSSADEIFKEKVDKFQEKQAWDPRPLCACLEVLAAHSLSVHDLRRWLEVVTHAVYTGRAQNLLLSLEKAMLGTETKGPSHTFEFDGESSGLLGPGESRWPFTNGYAFVTWLYIESFADTLNTASAAAAIAAAAAAKSGKSSAMSAAAAASALAGEGTAHMPRLFSFLSSDNQGVEAYFHGQFLVVECGTNKGKKASLHFTHAFQPRCWYFIGLEHLNKQGILGKSESELKLYLNGQLFESRPFEFPRISKPLAFCCIGTNPPPTIAGLQRRRRQCPLFAEMGPIYIFKEPIGPERMLRLCFRGGDTIPSFGNSGLPSSARNELARALADESFSLDAEIEPRIHLLYHPKLLVGRSCPDASPSGQSGTHRRPAEILGHVSVAARCRAVEAMWAVAEGGILSLLPLTVSAVDKETYEPAALDHDMSHGAALLAASIFRMISVAVHHPGNSEELNWTHAPEMLSRLLHYLLAVLSNDKPGTGKPEARNEELVAAVVSLCQSPQSNFGLKVQLFTNLLLDLKIWSRCTYGLQKKLLSSLADMVFSEATTLRTANAIQLLLDGCRQCYWVVRENDSVDTFAAGKLGRATGEVNALVDELLVIVELLVGYSTAPMAVNDVKCLIGFLLDCPQPNQVARVLHLIYRLIVQPNTLRAKMFAETFMSCGGIEMLLYLLRREAELGDQAQSDASNKSNRKCEANEGDERDSPTSTEETKHHDDQIKVQGEVDSENIDNAQEKTLHGVHEKGHAPIRRLSSTDSQRMQTTREAFAGRNVGGISFSISPESARNNFYNVDSGDGILVGVIRLLGALVSGGQLKFSFLTSPFPTSSPNFSGDQNQSEESSDAAVVNNSFVLFALQKAFQAAPSRLMTDAVYAALLGAAINISSTEDNHNLNLYDSGNKFEHIQLLLVLLRSLPYASRSLQLRAIQDILFLACSSSDNRNTLTSMPEWPEWLLEVLISNYERGLEELENGSLMTEVEDLVHNFLIIMLEHSMRQKDGWKDVEATLHCAEWLALIGGSSTGEQRVRREESLPVLKRRLLGGLMEFAARELQGQTQVIAAAAAGVAAGGLSPQVAKAEAESATYLSVALAENAIVLLMFVEDHLRFQCQIFNNSKAASGIVTPFSTLFSPVGRALSFEKETSENAVYRRISSANESGGLPLDVLASMADENGQISASAMERLTAAVAAEPYESVRCAFLSYGSCASDLAEGWKRRSRMWYGVGLPSNAGGFGGGGSGWEAWGSAFEKDENGDWVELPLIKRSVAMLQALLLDESGLGSGLAAAGGSGNLTGGMVALQQLLDSDQPFLTMLRMVLVAMREEDKGDESSLSNSISFREDSLQMNRTASRKPRSALLWSVLNPILSMSVSESRRQRILVAACILYAEVWHAVDTDRKPLRKQYLEMILPPFVALLRRWRPILCGIHDLTDPDGMNPLAIDERALAGDALPLEAALAMVTSGWAAAFASPPAAMALAMAAAGAGGEIAPPKGTHLRREMSILERRASKLRSLSSLQRVPDSPVRSSSAPKDKASAKAAALAAARDNERNAKIGSGRGLSAVAMATSAQRRGVGDRERVKRWNIFDAMVTAWLECSFSLGKQKIVERDFSGLVLKYIRALASMVVVAKELKQAEIDRRVVAAVAADYRTKVGSHAWRRMIRCLIEHEALFGPLTYQFSESKQVFWKLDFVENSLRMRRRLKRNYKGKAHVGAGANYGDFQHQEEDKREDTQDFSLKVSNSLTSTLPANATILPPEEYPLDEAHEEEGSSEICEEKYDLTGENVNSPNSTVSKDAATLDSIDAGTPKESIVADMPRAGTVVIEPDERMLLEIAAVMVQPLALVRGRFQVTTKRINFVLDESADVGDAYNGNSDDRYENGTKAKDQSWHVSVLREVYSRRYLLRRSALELFVTDRSNFFFNFGTTEFRRKAYKAIVQAKPPYLNSLYYRTQNPEQLLKRTQLMERWARWEISNFEYLMQLNTLAGRSYNDITQYPVFPWVLADYKSTTLDFNNPTIYRDLSKPVGALNPGRLEKFLERYSNFDDPVIPKFHYGSHYSSAGTVLYYLARVEPFTTLSIQLQGGKFDHADRLFSDIGATWDGVLEDMSDVKELVPELYYLPEVLTNENHVDFGTTQHGEKIDNVKLPPWAQSPVDFINKHRTALESEHVSAHLHEWIDLIFGYKQRGKEAIDAHNLFFYVTYEGAVDIDKISDPVLRHATQDQIAYFGQTPSQLLSFPHIRRRPLSDMLHLQTIFRNPRDIKPYAVAISERCNVPASAICASTDAIVIVDNNLPGAHIALHKWQPNTPDGHGIPFLFQHGKATSVSGGGAFMRMFKTQAAGSEIWEFPRAVAIPAAGVQTSYIVDITPDLYVITGGHADNTVKLISPENAKALESAAGHCAPVTCLAVSPDGSTLVTGSRDSTAILWRLLANSDKSPLNRAETNAQADSTKRHIEGPLHVLRGHIGELTCCCINADLDLVVSCNGEGTILLHSISKGRLIRRLEVNHGVDIVSLSSEGIIVVWDKSCKQLETFTINGIPVSKVKLFPFHGDITCIEIGQDGRHAVFGTRSVTNPLEEKASVSTGQENKSQGNASRDRLSSVTVPSVCLLDLHTLEILHILELQEGQDVTALALNKDNTNLVVSLLDKQLLIYTDPSLSVKVVDQMLRLGWQGDGLAPLISH